MAQVHLKVGQTRDREVPLTIIHEELLQLRKVQREGADAAPAPNRLPKATPPGNT